MRTLRFRFATMTDLCCFWSKKLSSRLSTDIILTFKITNIIYIYRSSLIVEVIMMRLIIIELITFERFPVVLMYVTNFGLGSQLFSSILGVFQRSLTATGCLDEGPPKSSFELSVLCSLRLLCQTGERERKKRRCYCCCSCEQLECSPTDFVPFHLY